MQNVVAIGTHTARQRRDWERAVIAASWVVRPDQRTEQAGWALLQGEVVAGLRSRLAPRVPITGACSTAGKECAVTVKGRHAAVA